MIKLSLILGAALLAAGILAGSPAAFAQAAEADKVVGAVKAKNPNLKTLCATGPDGIRKAVGDETSALAKSGQIKGDFAAIGQMAGGKIRAECGG